MTGSAGMRAALPVFSVWHPLLQAFFTRPKSNTRIPLPLPRHCTKVQCRFPRGRPLIKRHPPIAENFSMRRTPGTTGILLALGTSLTPGCTEHNAAPTSLSSEHVGFAHAPPQSFGYFGDIGPAFWGALDPA